MAITAHSRGVTDRGCDFQPNRHLYAEERQLIQRVVKSMRSLPPKVGNFAYCITRDNSKSINSDNTVEAIIARMNVLLQKHGAKHIYKVPEGLRELCTDIAREVLRSQPGDIYCFIADYAETLLITRENAKVAVKVVNNILLGSEAVVDILYRSGLSLEQIARAAPRIQKAFRVYLDAVDMRAAQVCEDATRDEKPGVSPQNILQANGVSREQAEKAATVIQTAYRSHYARMLQNESQGMVQWQRASARTLEILRRVGASQAEASKAAVLIQAAYRGYYTRNLKKKTTTGQEQKDSKMHLILLDITCEETRLASTEANEAASIIQNAYKRYRVKKGNYNVPRIQSTQPIVAEAILQKLYHRVFDEVVTRTDIPAEFGNREDLEEASKELRRSFEDRLRRARATDEDGNLYCLCDKYSN